MRSIARPFPVGGFLSMRLACAPRWAGPDQGWVDDGEGRVVVEVKVVVVVVVVKEDKSCTFSHLYLQNIFMIRCRPQWLG